MVTVEAIDDHVFLVAGRRVEDMLGRITVAIGQIVVRAPSAFGHALRTALQAEQGNGDRVFAKHEIVEWEKERPRATNYRSFSSYLKAVRVVAVELHPDGRLVLRAITKRRSGFDFTPPVATLQPDVEDAGLGTAVLELLGAGDVAR